jgi:hypothetical protein
VILLWTLFLFVSFFFSFTEGPEGIPDLVVKGGDEIDARCFDSCREFSLNVAASLS